MAKDPAAQPRRRRLPHSFTLAPRRPLLASSRPPGRGSAGQFSGGNCATPTPRRGSGGPSRSGLAPWTRGARATATQPSAGPLKSEFQEHGL